MLIVYLYKNNMQKTKNTIYTAIITLLSTAISSVLSLVSTNLILKNYGSDFNGVVATVNQLMNVLLLLEGGFTLAINVALFKYYAVNDDEKIKSILAAADKIFTKIGFIFLITGVILSVVYPLIINSELDYVTIVSIFLMLVFSTFFNLAFTTKYRIMFQTAQIEYKISLIGLIVNTIGSLITILLVYLNLNMLYVRLAIMLFSILNGIIIFFLYKKEFSKYYFKNSIPEYSKIKGTKDIMAQKLTGAIYSSAPLIYISTFINTMFSSIYAVYNSIYSIAKVVLNSLISAPINGFGLLIAEKDRDYVYQKFSLYEYIIVLTSNLLLTPIMIMIIPFISLYTKGIDDINYINYGIASMMAIVLFLEIIHIPSGSIINLSGNFKIAKKIQYITMVLLLLLLFIGGTTLGIYGILIGTILTNLVLAIMEIVYAHKVYFNKSVFNLIKVVIINLSLSFLLNFLVSFFNIYIINYIDFFICGTIVFCFTSFFIVLVNLLFFKKQMVEIFSIVKSLVFKKKK